MRLFRQKLVPGSLILPEPRLEEIAVEHAIYFLNSGFVGIGDSLKTWESFEYFTSKPYSSAKSQEELQMIKQRSTYLQEQMQKNRWCTLYARFDIDKIGTVYDETCCKVVFQTVPYLRLLGSTILVGNSQATLAGFENVFVIGFWASLLQLELISQSLSKSIKFKNICASNPLQLYKDDYNHKKEPLTPDGVVVIDGIRNVEEYSRLAADVYECLKKNGELAT